MTSTVKFWRKDMSEMQTKPAPANLKEEHLLFLDNLRESGVTNMFGAAKYVELKFKLLTRAEATEVLSYWMRTFSERHPKI